MTPKEMLARWVGIERGDGLERARRLSRYLSIASFILFIGAAIASLRFDLHPFFTLFAGMAAGYLLAERNALQWRFKLWPVIRQYIDWPRVEKDLEQQQP